MLDVPIAVHPVGARASSAITHARLLGAAVGFGLSLLPSLLPRGEVGQGLLSGLLLVLGASAAGGLARLARRAGRRRPPVAVLLLLDVAIAVLVAALAWHWAGWQNSLRDQMGMPSLPASAWPVLLTAAGVLALGMAGTARLLRRVAHRIATRIGGPDRLALVLLAVLMLGTAASLVAALVAATASFSTARDAGTTAGTVQPTSALRSGSPDSLVDWDTLGRKGRDFVSWGPTIAEINGFSGGGALQPIRVYVGKDSAPTVAERARLAVAELRRTGAFERSALVVAMPTGTGLVEPFAADALEYLRNGDTALVSVSYSDLPSWLSVVTDRAAVRDTAQSLFDEVYGAWRQVPAGQRPDLYVYGHSLGAYGLHPVVESFEDLPVPASGALLAGRPFTGPLADDLPGVLSLQHATDPVALVRLPIAVQRPSWLGADRPAAVSPAMQWLPMVTMLQVAADLPQAVFVPWGFGHMYSERDYVLGWSAVAGGVSGQRVEELVDRMRNDSSPVSQMLA